MERAKSETKINPHELDAMRTYIDGKMRRYNLLFAVNGGAFAIGKLMAGKDVNIAAFGQLTPRGLAIGMMVFTILMAIDIWAFGVSMRDHYLPDLVFQWKGQAVLVLICTLIVGGWFLVYLPISWTNGPFFVLPHGPEGG